jgi:hypothetical protein
MKAGTLMEYNWRSAENNWCSRERTIQWRRSSKYIYAKGWIHTFGFTFTVYCTLLLLTYEVDLTLKNAGVVNSRLATQLVITKQCWVIQLGNSNMRLRTGFWECGDILWLFYFHGYAWRVFVFNSPVNCPSCGDWAELSYLILKVADVGNSYYNYIFW